MAGFLRVLGLAVLVSGITGAAVTGRLFAGYDQFQEVAAAYARHPEHVLFQTQYWAAAVWHYGLLALTAVGLLGGIVLGGLLLGLGELLRRVPPRSGV